MRKREYKFIFDFCYCNNKRNDDDNQIGMKLRRNMNILLLNIINWKHLPTEEIVSQDIISIGMIQSWVNEVFLSEEFLKLTINVQQNYLFPGILKLNMYVISQYIG